MADAYWMYTDGRAATALHVPQPPVKRPRSDYDLSGVPEYHGYMPRAEERVGHGAIRDTETIEASYERYLRNAITYGAGESGRPVTGTLTSRPVDDPRMMGVGSMDSRSVEYGGDRPELSRRSEISLPPEASNTLFVEGLPASCTRREVSHIFRPFVGFREVRLVNKESRIPGGDPLVLCFVDFSSPSQAAVALDALQGYKFDEHDRDSSNLRLQFARFPGPRSSGGPRNRR